MSIQPRAKRRHATHMLATVSLHVQCEVTHTHADTTAVRLTKCVYKMQVRTFFQRDTHTSVCARDTRAAQRGGLCAHLHNVAKKKRRRQHPHSIVQKNTHEDTRANLQTHEDAKHKRTRRCTSAKSNVPIPNWKTSRKNIPAAVFASSSPEASRDAEKRQTTTTENKAQTHTNTRHGSCSTAKPEQRPTRLATIAAAAATSHKQSGGEPPDQTKGLTMARQQRPCGSMPAQHAGQRPNTVR